MWIAVVHGETVQPNEEWFGNPYKYCSDFDGIVASLEELVEMKWQEIFQRFIRGDER